MANFLKQIKEKVSDIMNQKAEPPRLTMRVCMLGVRGVGKTSVITSMYNSNKTAIAGTDLFLVAENETDQILSVKKSQLEGIFNGLHHSGDLVMESGIPGDSIPTTFKFTYGISSERVNIDLEIRDYPGEYLEKDPETVAGYVKEADAVLIAIDTPCMMEEQGRFHDGKNQPQLVMNFLMENLDSDSDKLVLLVPLKCEKYYIERAIDQVTDKVRESYAELLSHLKGQKAEIGGKKRSRVCCAITPIKTLGDVAFDSFQLDADGNILELRGKGGKVLPERINYHFNASDARYRPEFCEQPLYYLLAFVAKKYNEVLRIQQSENNIFQKLREALRMIPNIDKFETEITKLSLSRREQGEGYRVLFGRGRI